MIKYEYLKKYNFFVFLYLFVSPAFITLTQRTVCKSDSTQNTKEFLSQDQLIKSSLRVFNTTNYETTAGQK